MRSEPPKMNRGGVRAIAAICVAAGCIAAAGCGATPQLGHDECFSAADALWTAITARDVRLLDQCERDLRRLNARGLLSDDAHASLQRPISTARQGDWRPAAEELGRFVKSQRKVQKRRRRG